MIRDNHNQKYRVVEPSPRRQSTPHTMSIPKALDILQKMGQKDFKSQRNMEFAVKLFPDVRSYTHRVSPTQLPNHELYNGSGHANVNGRKFMGPFNPTQRTMGNKGMLRAGETVQCQIVIPENDGLQLQHSRG